MVFFPSLWVHAVFVSPQSALYAGTLWLVLRVAYGFVYRSNAKQTPNLLVFTLPCYHLLGYLALAPLAMTINA